MMAYGFAVVDCKAEEGVGPLGRVVASAPRRLTTTRRGAAHDTDFFNEFTVRDTRSTHTEDRALGDEGQGRP